MCVLQSDVLFAVVKKIKLAVLNDMFPIYQGRTGI